MMAIALLFLRFALVEAWMNGRGWISYHTVSRQCPLRIPSRCDSPW